MKKVYIVTCIDTTSPFTTREWVFKNRIAAVEFVVKALQVAAELERARHYAALEVTYTLDGEECSHLWDSPDCESLPIGTSDVSYPLHTFQRDFVRYFIKRVDVLDGEECSHLWDSPDCESLPIGTSDVSYPLHTFQRDFVCYFIKRVDVLEG